MKKEHQKFLDENNFEYIGDIQLKNSTIGFEVNSNTDLYRKTDIVYIWTTDKIIYVGETKNSFETRWSGHKNSKGFNGLIKELKSVSGNNTLSDIGTTYQNNADKVSKFKKYKIALGLLLKNNNLIKVHVKESNKETVLGQEGISLRHAEEMAIQKEYEDKDALECNRV